jgi:hypothetical protein
MTRTRAEHRLEAYAPVRIAITNLQTSTSTRLALERYPNTLAAKNTCYFRGQDTSAKSADAFICPAQEHKPVFCLYSACALFIRECPEVRSWARLHRLDAYPVPVPTGVRQIAFWITNSPEYCFRTRLS